MREFSANPDDDFMSSEREEINRLRADHGEIQAELILRYDRVRTFANFVQEGFEDRGGHYEYVGEMNTVNALRDAIEDLETFMQTYEREVK